MKVAIIGSGNVATHLTNAFKQAQVDVVALWSRNLINAQKLAQETQTNVVETLAELVTLPSDVILIAVKDDSIPEVAIQLAPYPGIVAHVSGAKSLASLYPAKKTAVFYPYQTFSKQKAIDFKNVPLCIEASDEVTLSEIQQLAAQISDKVYLVSSDKRKYLHLAAAFACNFTNYLYGAAQQILLENELDFELIRPLIKETAEKVQCAIPSDVQTGPAIRNDEKTLADHRQLLLHNEEYLAIYQLLSKQIQTQTT